MGWSWLKKCNSTLRGFLFSKEKRTFAVQNIFDKKSVTIRKVIDALERFAPLPLQEGYDNAGLQVGLTEAEVSGALLCLDVTEAIIDEAVARGCNLVVAHHPLIFRKLACISDGDYVQRTVMKAIREGVAIVAMHTNLDNARGGVNFKMAERMGLRNVDFMAEPRMVEGIDGASGVVGELAEPMEAHAFVAMLKERFGAESVRCNELLKHPIRRVALCGGAGSFLLGEALKAGADAFVTGEMGYHEFFGHEQQIQIAVIGHYESELATREIFRDIIERECEGVRCLMAETNTNPIKYL